MSDKKIAGFTKVNNILLEALSLSKLSGVQKSICLFIIRRTVGWGKADDAISLREFAEATGSSKSYISEQLKKLISNKVVHRNTYQPGKIPRYFINNNIGQWDNSVLDYEAFNKATVKGVFTCSKPFNNKNPSVNAEEVSSNVNEVFAECETEGFFESGRVLEPISQKPPVLKVVPKERLKKDKEINIFSSNSDEYKLSVLLLEKIKTHLPGFKEPDLQNWAKGMDAILRLDKRDINELKAVIDFAQNDSFWRSNILSPAKLRKQYDQLNAKRLQQARNYSQKGRKADYGKGVLKNDSYENFFK